MTNRTAFLSVLRERLYPQLRQTGFKGSGETLRRSFGEVLHVFNVQGSDTATRCYVNLGAHLNFVPTAGGGIVDAKKIKEYECAFRVRIEPPAKYNFGWPYGSSAAETTRVIDELIAAYAEQGEAFWSRWSRFPDSFVSVTPEDLESSGLSRGPMPLVFAQISLHVGHHESARRFAELGLANVGPAAVGLRRTYERILGAA